MKPYYKLIISYLLVTFVIVLFFGAKANATVYNFDLALSALNEVPPNASPATGTLIGTYDDAANLLSFTLMFNGLIGTTTAAHFHGPAPVGTNGGVQIALIGFPAGVTFGNYSNSFVLTPEQESDLLCGLWYVNIHTTAFPGGEIRSQVKEGTTSGDITALELGLTGMNEVPPNASPATGIFTATYDDAANLLSLTITFNGLIGLVTAAHIHGPAGPGVNGPVIIPLTGFPVGVTSGNYFNVFPVTPEQETMFLGGQTYVNIHSTFLPGGEIRGQLIEGTLIGDCGGGDAVIPVSNWAIVLGILLMTFFTALMLRKRS